MLASPILRAQYLYPIAGKDSCGITGDGGKAKNARVSQPGKMCIDHHGNLYFTDGTAGSAVIRKINAATGIITTIAGGGANHTDTADNIPIMGATLGGFTCICLDTAGNIIFSDGYARVRKLNFTTGLVTTIAGKCEMPGYSGDGGLAVNAQLKVPQGVKVDTANNIYIADNNNHCIRKVDAVTGIITTIAGTPTVAGLPADGIPATSATFNKPFFLHIDKSGNLYIWDGGNACLRKIDAATGIINTVVPGSSVNYLISDMKEDKTGNIYMAGGNQSCIYKMNPVTYAVTTYAGTLTAYPTSNAVDSKAYGGKVDTVKTAALGLAFDTCGNLFFTRQRCEIAVITPTSSPKLCQYLLGVDGPGEYVGAQGLQLMPNPSNGTFTLMAQAAENEPLQVIVTNTLGQKVKEIHASTNRQQEISLDVPQGIYFISATTANNRWSAKIVVNE
jgi:hypothetical protein